LNRQDAKASTLRKTSSIRAASRPKTVRPQTERKGKGGKEYRWGGVREVEKRGKGAGMQPKKLPSQGVPWDGKPIDEGTGSQGEEAPGKRTLKAPEKAGKKQKESKHSACLRRDVIQGSLKKTGTLKARKKETTEKTVSPKAKCRGPHHSTKVVCRPGGQPIQTRGKGPTKKGATNDNR